MKLDKLLTSLLLIFFHWGAIAQEEYVWSKSVGGFDNDAGNDATIDANGNCYVIGTYTSPTLVFGSITLTNAMPGQNEIFFAKYDPSGKILWAKSLPGDGDDRGISVTNDINGNAIITGTFESRSIVLDAITLTNCDTSGSADLFVAKYDPSGNILWAKSAGGNNWEVVKKVTTDPGGNIFITGLFFSGMVTFGSFQFAQNGPPVGDMFIAKYNPSGDVTWAATAGGTRQDFGEAVCSDASGNIIVAGSFNSSDMTFDHVTLSNTGNNDIFIVKYSPTGHVLWAIGVVGNHADIVHSVSTDLNGNIFITGYYLSKTLTLGPITLHNPKWERRAYIAKIDADGKGLWAKDTGGPNDRYNEGVSVATDSKGNVFLVGNFISDTITFDSHVLMNRGIYNIFFVKYSSAGDVLWAKSMGGSKEDFISCISINKNNELCMTGKFSSPKFTIGSNEFINAGVYDLFIAKLGSPPNGIDKSLNPQTVIVFPNPSRNRITIKTTNKVVGSVYSIYNQNGQEIMSGKLDTEATSIDWSDLPNGLYMIVVNNKQALKVVKE